MAFELNTVLVRTLYPSNIGSAARGVANMGGNRLILIDPYCEPVASKAKMAAAGAQPFLDTMVVYDKWTDFYAAEGGGFRIAFTARDGRRREVKDFSEILRKTKRKNPETLNQPVYLIFGPEDNGLDNDDLQFVNACASLSTYGTFKSLNLSQAVLLANFVAQSFFRQDDEIKKAAKIPTRERRPMYFPDQTIKNFIEAIGFDIDARKASAYLTLKKLLLQNDPSDDELRVLEAILQQAIRKLT